MRELTANEIEQVSGGKSLAEYAGEGGAVGSILGAVTTGTIYGAMRGGVGGALLMATYGLTYNTTTYILESM